MAKIRIITSQYGKTPNDSGEIEVDKKTTVRDLVKKAINRAFENKDGYFVIKYPPNKILITGEWSEPDLEWYLE